MSRLLLINLFVSLKKQIIKNNTSPGLWASFKPTELLLTCSILENRKGGWKKKKKNKSGLLVSLAQAHMPGLLLIGLWLN